MASTIGSTIASFGDSYIPALGDNANIQTALQYLYFGSSATANTSNGIYGALYTLYSGSPTIGGSSGTVTIPGNLTLSTTGKTLTLPAGSSSVAPLKFNGTSTTTQANWAAGNVEYSGQTYIATSASNSGPTSIATPYWSRVASASPVSLSTGMTTAFGSSISLAAGAYEFELYILFQYTYVAPTTTNLTLGIKGTAVASEVNFLQEYWTRLSLFGDNASYTNSSQTWRRSTTSQSLTISNLTTSMGGIGSGSQSGVFKLTGNFVVTTAGTVFPSATFAGTGNGSILGGSFIKITPLGSSGGYWSALT